MLARAIKGTSTAEGRIHSGRQPSALPVVRELERDRDVFGLPERLDHGLQRVLVLADHAQLVALDADLHLGADVLDPLAQVTGDLIRDAGVQRDLDLAAALADRLRVAGLEQLRRQRAACRLLAEDLERRARPL